MKQQIHIISDAITQYNESVLSLRANEEKLKINIIKFIKFANQTVNVVDSLSYSQTVTDHFNTLSLLISDLDNKFDVITRSILFS